MYGNTAKDFQARMKPFIQNTPLQAARPGVDEEQYIKDAEKEGGSPGYEHEIAGMYIPLRTLHQATDLLISQIL